MNISITEDDLKNLMKALEKRKYSTTNDGKGHDYYLNGYHIYLHEGTEGILPSIYCKEEGEETKKHRLKCMPMPAEISFNFTPNEKPMSKVLDALQSHMVNNMGVPPKFFEE